MLAYFYLKDKQGQEYCIYRTENKRIKLKVNSHCVDLHQNISSLSAFFIQYRQSFLTSVS